MNDDRTLRLATRGSPLALAQSEAVAEALRRAWPGLKIELHSVLTRGDLNRQVPLSALVGEDGVFTRGVEAEVLAGRADLAVHSLKDLPTQSDQRLVLAAVSYSNIVLTDTTNDVSTSVAGVSRTFFAI